MQLPWLAMTTSSKLLLFLFAAILPAHGAEEVQLQTSPVINQRELKGLKIESKRIGGQLSIELWRCQDVTISHCDLAGIYLTECERVTITNCFIHDTVRNGVEIMRSKEVRVQGCRIENVSSAVYAQESQNLQIVGIFARNVNGPFPRGQMVQFNNVTGHGNVISGNYAINDHGRSNPEDVISLFQSHGTAESPILIEDNYMTGDATLGSADKSKSGSGIMLGDCGGSFQTCRRNTILSAGQVGIGVAGGDSIVVEDNVIFGSKSNVSNTGLYAWNQSDHAGATVTFARNRVLWINHDGIENSYWDGGGFTRVIREANQFGQRGLLKIIPEPPSPAPVPPSPVADEGNVVRLPWKP